MASLTTTLSLEVGRIWARLQFNSDRRLRLYREFAGLLKSGFSRGKALEILWRIASRDGARLSEPVAIVLADARNGVRNGLSLADSFVSWIPREDYMLIKAIEDGDEFAHHLEDWCTTLESRSGLRANAVSSLFYPAFLMMTVYALLVFFDNRIMPPLEAILPRERWTGAAALFQATSAAASRYIWVTAIVSGVVPLVLLASFPHWIGTGRHIADRLPLYSLYRAHCGLSLLQALGALMSGGLSASDSIRRISDGANPYSRSRLELILRHLLNGRGLGEAMQAVADGWPDPELAVSMRAHAHSPEFPAQILRMAKDWRRVIHQRTERTVSAWRLISFLAVFAVVSGTVSAMYEIQSQIALGLH
ncbi:MAG: type II secretion system F family protein [Rhodobacteraceae bacterium]|nr:type II secretion system F family protein [Paracoccaceae bacterium]